MVEESNGSSVDIVAVNVLMIYKNLHRDYKKPYLDFLVELVEELIHREKLIQLQRVVVA